MNIVKALGPLGSALAALAMSSMLATAGCASAPGEDLADGKGDVDSRHETLGTSQAALTAASNCKARDRAPFVCTNADPLQMHGKEYYRTLDMVSVWDDERVFVHNVSTVPVEVFVIQGISMESWGVVEPGDERVFEGNDRVWPFYTVLFRPSGDGSEALAKGSVNVEVYTITYGR